MSGSPLVDTTLIILRLIAAVWASDERVPYGGINGASSPFSMFSAAALEAGGVQGAFSLPRPDDYAVSHAAKSVWKSGEENSIVC